ncbi:MotA/TolQ/ExbB proton channel family protein [Aliiglaciecola sp. CAU 1673]|uniref:MotA/TolQ/ExbB proton channel family protein n=1 Tax=Aliiglaciecola sp. CAU 1673 TaxID=3032595 RepID=UPI0023D9FB54|nr:MotA/TolQ/ExbB proton channel family protein [Aliiglaciecola sp. CAU 1673]MDF2177853.1 MotA/TolQ/ExbB proton channel family protein [Aliiglaciecola sp. CAU 1673]
MDISTVVVRFFQEGGPFMFPIAIVLALGLAIAVERYLFLSFARRTNKKAFAELEPLLLKSQYEQVIQFGERSDAPIGRVIAAGISRLGISPRREDIEYAMEEGLMETIPRLEKRTGYLGTLANISTLLGLLGTIIGLIAAFSAVANADPAEKASLLSQSISVAMNTTAFGLIAAIPLLGLHSILQTRTTEIIDSMEMAGVKCLNLLIARNGIQPKTRSSDQ